MCLYDVYYVAPFVGAWIEIRDVKLLIAPDIMSLRSSERGLKYMKLFKLDLQLLSLRSSERGLKCVSCWQHRSMLGRSVRRSVD